MKTRIAILLVVELMAAIALISMSHSYRPATARAFMAWHTQRTPENRAELDRQLKIQNREQLMVDGVLWLGFSALAVPAFLLFPIPKTPSTAPLAANP